MTSPRLAPDTAIAVRDFLDTAANLERRLDRSLSFVRGVSYSEYRLLDALAAAEFGLPRVELAAAVGLTASAVTRALKPLEKLGYVTTERGARDARQALARITPAGRELLDDANGVLDDVLSELPISGISRQKLAAFQERLDDLGRT